MGLDLIAGHEGASAPIRWVHASELPDPTPWLSGGELILTTGMQLSTPEAQQALVERLASHHVAGLGFGTGFDHDEVPKALLDEAGEHGFPVFEVPYALPFIAITEKAFTSLVNEQYEVLQRSIAVHRRLQRPLLQGRGPADLTRAGGAALRRAPSTSWCGRSRPRSAALSWFAPRAASWSPRARSSASCPRRRSGRSARS